MKLKESVATMRTLLEADAEKAAVQAVKALNRIVKTYAKHQRADDASMPKTAMPGVPMPGTREGRLRVIENQVVHEGMFARQVRVGMAIGINFADGDREVISKVRDEVIKVIKALTQEHKGFIVNVHGSSYSVIGWALKG